jgi:hypothetical protein
MLELFDQNPQSRVFRVDRECYIVYLGAHWEDYKPFLRVGTSTSLPASLPPIVSSIIVPDVLTGNPLDEPASLAGDAGGETHYIGDVKTVEAMKAFVGQDTIPVEAIEAIDHEEDDGKHVLVYYYKDGNLKIKFRKNEIFDLRRREKLDGHYVAHANDVKNQYGRSPFKLPGDAYQDPGFIVAGSVPYLVSRGQLAALDLASDYFFTLSSAALDADRVATVRSDDPDAALIRFFKRARTRNRAVHVVSVRPERVKAAAGLFRENSQLPIRAVPVDASSGRYEFQRFTVTDGGGRTIAALEGRPGSVIFGEASKSDTAEDIRVDVKDRSILVGGRKYSLLQGMLYQLASGDLTRTAIETDYLPEKNYPYRDMLSQGESALIGQLQYFFSELFAGRDSGKVIKTIRGLDVVRGRAAVHPLVQILVHNAIEFCRFISATESRLSSGADALESAVSRLGISAAGMPAFLPIVGELYQAEEGTFLFYRFAQRITSDRYAHAESIAESIAALPSVDYEAERKRLEDLIAGLATPEQMDEARMRRIAEAKKPAQKKPTPTSEAEAVAEAAAAEPEEGFDSADGRGGRRRRSRGGWIIAAAAIIIIALLLGLLLTGVIPNRWFGDETQIVDSGGDGTDAGDQTDAAGTDGSDGTAADGTDASADGTDQAGADSSADGADAAGTDGTAVDGQSSTADGQDGAASAGDAASDSTSDPGVTVPPGWEDSLPALRALDQERGVTITDTSVIGPGGIEITLNDIILLVNQIATENGYDTMDEQNPLLPDPDWIYPGNVFVLPNSARYTVEEGDSIWVIAIRYMLARLRLDYAEYTRLSAEYEEADTTVTRRAEIVRSLRGLAAESHTENFALLVDETISGWSEE